MSWVTNPIPRQGFLLSDHVAALDLTLERCCPLLLRQVLVGLTVDANQVSLPPSLPPSVPPSLALALSLARSLLGFVLGPRCVLPTTDVAVWSRWRTRCRIPGGRRQGSLNPHLDQAGSLLLSCAQPRPLNRACLVYQDNLWLGNLRGWSPRSWSQEKRSSSQGAHGCKQPERCQNLRLRVEG